MIDTPRRHGLPGPEEDDGRSGPSTDHCRAPPARLRYTYDFGDDWEHNLVVEGVSEAQPDAAYPRCLTGRRACPPEDCGGIWGYRTLVEILADPGHDEHVERLGSLGLDDAGQLDPAAFGVAEVNAALSRLMPPPGGSRG